MSWKKGILIGTVIGVTVFIAGVVYEEIQNRRMSKACCVPEDNDEEEDEEEFFDDEVL